ncbi:MULTISPECIES: cation:proton antiporter [Cyanophyceae]|uniref:cation:proton antiporter domain-containing protein n=1 Tax=Cyanophyceae TaxID=3028117 RepID=UPI001682B2F0|nr:MULTISPECIES: cation:proton antiporter [Cyanophyceae]MBD1916799.1 cation:proton antiporter [Phormidium sp. FACHB-77]MBD2029429.1 cation:proton antiporter [Phormidium sp. FACHB-322]MBD2052005.1 cation:proton antiporter [Leptolyngbya sp. FACHB-60]
MAALTTGDSAAGLLSFLPDSPIVAFTVLLLVTLIIPPIFERLRLPGLVGLLAAGVLLGPSVAGLLDPAGEVETLLSDVGKIYLMFVAGLEIDLKNFKRTRNRSLGFGFTTFAVPLIAGILLSRIFGFNWITAVLVGSLLASHTLLAYPIVMRLGITKEPSVGATVGATIFTDIGALLVLAMCVAAQAGEFSARTVVTQLVMLSLFATAVLVGIDWVGKQYFKRNGDREGNQFLFVLAAVFLAAVGSQLINVDKIVGAFLAGLAVNDVVGNGPVKEKVEFVGGVLFIPFFFVCMGLLLDLEVFVESMTTNLAFTLALTGTLIISKFLAALATKPFYKYSWIQILTMWSLSMPQVAATLAAALVGLQQGIISDLEFNAVIVMMLITSVLGPLLTARFAGRLVAPKLAPTESDSLWFDYGAAPENREDSTITGPFTVVVPIYNPVTQRYLIEMAALLASHEGGYVIPVTVARAHVHMDDPNLVTALDQCRGLLQKAETLSQEFKAQAYSVLRIDDDVSEGITRTAREQNASLILLGWSRQGFRAKLFGTLVDEVFWSSHCPVAVARLLAEPIDIHRVLVPMKSITPQALRTVRFAQIFADSHQAKVTLLHVCDRHTPAEQVKALEAALTRVMGEGPQISWTLLTLSSDKPAEVILEAAQTHDMIVLRSMRRRTAGGLAVSNVTHQVIDEATCSLVLFGEPHT